MSTLHLIARKPTTIGTYVSHQTTYTPLITYHDIVLPSEKSNRPNSRGHKYYATKITSEYVYKHPRLEERIREHKRRGRH